MDEKGLIDRLLAQNEKLIDALVASSPVEVIRALNPPPPPAAPEQALDASLAADQAFREGLDVWADERVPTDALVLAGRSGWIGPFEQVATEAMGGDDEEAGPAVEKRTQE